MNDLRDLYFQELVEIGVEDMELAWRTKGLVLSA